MNDATPRLNSRRAKMPQTTPTNATPETRRPTMVGGLVSSGFIAIDLVLGRTLRIRRRRAQDVADTTDSLRALACIRFVRTWVGVKCRHGQSQHTSQAK